MHFDDDTIGPAEIGAKPINVQMADAQDTSTDKDGKHAACLPACLPAAFPSLLTNVCDYSGQVRRPAAK